MVLRRIDSKIPTTEELNLPPVIKQLAMTKRGIIIFVGATGSGKSTSLAAMVGYRNLNSTGHIITIEDPIEYVHKHEGRSEEHTSELQSLMRISYAVFCLKKKIKKNTHTTNYNKNK